MTKAAPASTRTELPEVPPHGDAPHTWRHFSHQGMEQLGILLPGLVLAGALGALATVLAQWIGTGLLGYEKSPVSAVLLTVLLGLFVRNVVGLPEIYDPGIRISLKQILRIGVALLGIRLSLTQAGVQGLIALPVVLGTILAALLLMTALTRLLGLPRRLGSLIAVGTSICGITAIVATAPVIGADEDETSYAVGTIAIFGMFALFAYPFLAAAVFGNAQHAGMFLGTAIHDTSQVAGAALAYEHHFGAPDALNMAVVTKLVRNLCMIAVIPLMAVLYHRSANEGAAVAAERRRFRDMVPLFIVGFMAMTALRTAGDVGDRPFGILDPDVWATAIRTTQEVAEVALLLAMASVGLATSLRRLRSLGLRPLGAGLSAALCVGLVGFLLIRLI